MATGRPTTHTGTTNEYRQLDVRYLHRKGLLIPGHLFTLCWASGPRPSSLRGSVHFDSITFSYSIASQSSGASLQRVCRVRLVRSACSYGGHRPWFHCPREGCPRKVAILYAGDTLACRHCHRLTYMTRRLDPRQRELLRGQALRLRLGGSPKFWEPLPPRPKGMREWTYTQLSLKILASERGALAFALALSQSLKNSGERQTAMQGR